MKKLLFLFLFIALQNITLAHQNMITARDTTLPSVILDNQKVDKPAAQSDQSAIYKAMGKMKYPPSAREKNISGKVIARMTIDEFGQIMDSKIISNTHQLLNDEVLRIVKLIPPYQPAVHQGKNVKVYIDFPLNFQMQ